MSVPFVFTDPDCPVIDPSKVMNLIPATLLPCERVLNLVSHTMFARLVSDTEMNISNVSTGSTVYMMSINERLVPVPAQLQPDGSSSDEKKYLRNIGGKGIWDYLRATTATV